MAKLEGPRRIANQAVVAGSACTSGTALLRNASTSASRPGFASSGTNSPTVVVDTTVTLLAPASVMPSSLTRQCIRDIQLGPAGEPHSTIFQQQEELTRIVFLRFIPTMLLSGAA